MNILKGTIFITKNQEVIRNANLQVTRIIDLDEDGALVDNASIIKGVCLLPPPEAKIAEADGNEQLYDMAYSSHLLEPYQQEFMAAILAYLYTGGNLILFLPEMGYTYTKEKIIQHMWNIYGIHIGDIDNQVNPNIANCYYDEKCVPIWLNLIYLADVMTPEAYLYYYPLDAPINNQIVLARLIDEVNPYGNTFIDKEKELERYRQMLHKNPKIKLAIRSM